MISNEMDPLVVNSGAAALDLIARLTEIEESSGALQEQEAALKEALS